MRWLPFLLVLGACASETRRSLAVPVEASGGEATFTAAGDVAVTLEVATVLVADLRLEAPAEEARALRLPGVRAAHAHPGHDFSGETTCELLGTWTVDLLAGTAVLGEATCLEGPLATGRVLLSGAPAVTLAGTAEVAGVPQAFRFEVALDEEVTGLVVEGDLDPDAPPVAILLQADPATMLSWADWTTADDDADGRLTLADGLLANTVPFGAVSTASWSLDITP